MVTRASAAGAALLLFATAAASEELPSWDVADICRTDSAPGQCRLFEARARNAISASWDLLTSEVRAACVAATRSPADQSWRTLADCIEVEVLRAKSERAIATQNTPFEPETTQSQAPAGPEASTPAPDSPIAPATPDQTGGSAAPPVPPGSAGQ